MYQNRNTLENYLISNLHIWRHFKRFSHTQLAKPTELRAVGEKYTDRLHHFFHDRLVPKFLHLCLMQHLNLKCPTNPKSFQPSTIQPQTQLRQRSSRSIRVQPPHFPTGHPRRMGKAGHRCDTSYASRGQTLLAFTGVHKQKTKDQGPKSEPWRPSPHFLQISCLWDFLTQHISGASTRWQPQGLRLHLHCLWKFGVASIAVRIQYPYPLAKSVF